MALYGPNHACTYRTPGLNTVLNKRKGQGYDLQMVQQHGFLAKSYD